MFGCCQVKYEWSNRLVVFYYSLAAIKTDVMNVNAPIQIRSIHTYIHTYRMFIHSYDPYHLFDSVPFNESIRITGMN